MSSRRGEDLFAMTSLSTEVIYCSKIASALVRKHWYINSETRLGSFRKIFFSKNGPFPASFYLFSSFQYTVDSKQTFNINFFCQWLDSKRGPLVLEETALPTEPQPLPIRKIFALQVFLKTCLNYLPTFWTILKSNFATKHYLNNFWKNWATFYSNIWSHCSDIIIKCVKGLLIHWVAKSMVISSFSNVTHS